MRSGEVTGPAGTSGIVSVMCWRSCLPDTSVEYSSSANPLNTDKLRHKRMLLALSVNIRIFSAPYIEGPPNIMGTLYLQY